MVQELQRFAAPGSGGNGNSSSSGGTAVGGAGSSLNPGGLAALQSGSAPSMQPSMPSGSMSMSLTGMPPLGLGLPGMGMLPQAAAAAAGFMTPGLPHIPPGAVGFGPGGLFPHMHPGWPPGTMPMAAAFGAGPGMPPGMFAAPPWPGMLSAPPNPASARYMVQVGEGGWGGVGRGIVRAGRWAGAPPRGPCQQARPAPEGARQRGPTQVSVHGGCCPLPGTSRCLPAAPPPAAPLPLSRPLASRT